MCSSSFHCESVSSSTNDGTEGERFEGGGEGGGGSREVRGTRLGTSVLLKAGIEHAWKICGGES